MFFVIRSQGNFLKRKNYILPVNNSFVLRNTNNKTEFL